MATTDNKFFTTMGRRGGSVGFAARRKELLIPVGNFLKIFYLSI
jgi:hypothetical protein